MTKTISVRQLLITLIPATAVLFVVGLVNLFFHISSIMMTRDVVAIANIPPLSGFVSSLGILLWCVAAATCGFAAVAVRDLEPKETYRFLLSSSILSAYLMLDDLFMFHEELASRYLGMNEKVVFLLLGSAVFIYIVVFRRVFSRTKYDVLLCALGFLATSVLLDTVLEDWLVSKLGENLQNFMEDGAKWLGIACWCSYYTRTSYQFLVNALGARKD